MIGQSSYPLNTILVTLLEESQKSHDRFFPSQIKAILERFYGSKMEQTNILQILNQL